MANIGISGTTGHITKTLLMANGAGYVLPLTNAGEGQGKFKGCSFVEVLARGACYVQPYFGDNPAVPAGSPVASLAGDVSEFVELQAGETVRFGAPVTAEQGTDQAEVITHILVWGLSASNLRVIGL